MQSTGGSPSRPKLQHVVMRFFFSGMKRALEFRDAIQKTGNVARLELGHGGNGWYIQTDTRVLEHAAELTRFIYGGAR